MKTLLIYDENGKVFFNITADENNLPIPKGLNHIVVEIPEGKIIADTEYQIDLSNGHPVVLLEDIPESDLDILKRELAEAKLAIDLLLNK